MILSPRGRRRGTDTGIARETLDALERVGEGARIWRKDFKLNEFSESGVDGVCKVGSPKGEDLEVPFDHVKREVLLLDRGS